MTARRFPAALIALAACLYATQAAATEFPARPIRIIAQFTPGTSTDILARLVAAKMGEDWGQQVIVDNRPGAGGIVGTEMGAKASPDGYTLTMAVSSAFGINPTLYSKLPYDAIKDFAPIANLGLTPQTLVANPSAPFKTVKEFVAAAKAKPGTIGAGLSGVGGVSHLTLELFKQRANINLLPVPYRGAAPALADVVGGTVPVIFSTLAAAKPLLDAGRVRALAVASAKRTSGLPNLPTFAELGYSGMDAPLWIGMMAPRGTPQSVIAKLNAEFVKALAAPDVKERLASQSADIVAAGPREFAETIRKDTERWRVVVKTANIKLE